MNQVSSELANGLNVGNEENGEFQISLISGWWAVFTEIKKTGKKKKKTGKKTFLEESLEFSLRCKFGIKSESQSCPTLWDPMDYIVRGILQARILEWVAFPFSRGSSQPRDRTQVSRIAGEFFTN